MSFELNYKSGITGQTITAKTQLLGTTTLSTAISCSEIGTTGEYAGSMTGSAGRYSVSFYASGVLVDSGQIDWDGTAEITGVSTSTQIGTRAATSDSRFAFLDASVAARPTNPLLTNDVRLNNIDVATSTRMATFTYTAPDNAGVAAVKAKTDQLIFTGANLNANAQVVADKTGYSVSGLSANVITAASINAAALNGKGDWLLSSSYTTPPTASAIRIETETSAVLAKQAKLDLVEAATTPNLTVATSTLATTAALSAVATTANTINTNTDSLEASLTTITAALPTAGAKIAGEGATVKNLDQLPTVATIATGVFSFAFEGSATVKDFLRVSFAILRGKTTGVGTSQNEFLGINDTIVRAKTIFDTAKNRLTVYFYGGD